MADRTYTVSHKRGYITVMVREGAIALRGEREAVAKAAWLKLQGKNELGEDVDKKSATREFIRDEVMSRYEEDRVHVYEMFRSKISFQWVGIVHG